MLPSRASLLILCGLLISTTATLAQKDEHDKSLEEMPAGAYKSDDQHTHIYFTYSHVGFFNAHGRFDKFHGQLNFVPDALEQSSVTFMIDPSSIDMNVPDLEQLLRGSGFFDTANIHEMNVVSRSFKRISENQGIIVGDLTMHGIAHSVALNITLNKFLIGKDVKFCRFGFTAAGSLKRSDWNLGAVPLVGDDVTLNIDAEFTKSVP